MRVWDVHPGYLSDKSLLGQHVEIHAIYSIISKNKKGYSAHPETRRWVGHLSHLGEVHYETEKEMILRGFGHYSNINDTGVVSYNLDSIGYVNKPIEQFQILKNKYKETIRGRIPLPQVSSQYWAHHKYSIMARGYEYYSEIKEFMGSNKDKLLIENDELIANISAILALDVKESAMANTLEHLWGYFKRSSSIEEKNIFFSCREEQYSRKLDFLYKLAKKYQQTYLLQSTIFADKKIRY